MAALSDEQFRALMQMQNLGEYDEQMLMQMAQMNALREPRPGRGILGGIGEGLRGAALARREMQPAQTIRDKSAATRGLLERLFGGGAAPANGPQASFGNISGYGFTMPGPAAGVASRMRGLKDYTYKDDEEQTGG